MLDATAIGDAGAEDGVIIGAVGEIGAFIDALKRHRFPRRKVDAVPA